jgi:hypothetical protein
MSYVIPFSVFESTSGGLLTANQFELEQVKLINVGITVMDGEDGPFQFDLAGIRAVNITDDGEVIDPIQIEAGIKENAITDDEIEPMDWHHTYARPRVEEEKKDRRPAWIGEFERLQAQQNAGFWKPDEVETEEQLRQRQEEEIRRLEAKEREQKLP